MNKIKNIITILLLLSLTAITVLLPLIFNTDSSSRLTEESTPYTRKNSEITPKQVAKLYATNELSSSLILSNSEFFSPPETRNNAKLLIDSIFTENDIAKNYVTQLTEGDINYYYKESYLVVLDNNPISLTFINIAFHKENTTFEIVFEEKTKTLIGLIIYSEKISEIPTKILSQSLCNYYENELSLSKYEYEYQINKNEFSCYIKYRHKYEEDVFY